MASGSPQSVPFRGIDITLGGVAYVLPPLSFGALEQHAETIGKLAQGQFDNALQVQGALVDVVHAALARNYPDLARETVRDALDWSNAEELFGHVMATAMPRARPGEPRAESPSGASTGS